METGLIFHPYMRPGRTARQTVDWGVANSIACDKAGFTNMLISEHASEVWQNIPNPELIMIAGGLQTSRIKFAPMSHILPHHHPAKLAVMIGWMSQILEGRYFLGIGAGGYPDSAYLHGIRNGSDTEFLNEMVRESLFIMEKLWKREPFFHEGKFWNAGFPEESQSIKDGDEQYRMADFSPFGGLPEIAVTGVSGNSPSMKLAGERNFKPITIFSGLDALKKHWEIYAEANAKAGFVPDRSRHAVTQTIFVADTDAEAKKIVMEGPIGYCFTRYLMPVFARFGLLDGFARDAGVDMADVDLEFLVDHVFLVGSPDTVVDKLNTLFEKCGGWGTMQVEAHDFLDDPSPWFYSLDLIAKEVAPRIHAPGAL